MPWEELFWRSGEKRLSKITGEVQGVRVKQARGWQSDSAQGEGGVGRAGLHSRG